MAIKDLNDVMASDFRNNCIKWHMALNKILAAQHLACKLKIVEYKILYVYLCQQIAFDIQNVIFSIEGYRFFMVLKIMRVVRIRSFIRSHTPIMLLVPMIYIRA